MSTSTVDLIINSQLKGDAARRAQKLENSLEDVALQAAKAAQKMESLAAAGRKMAIVGAALAAPLILAMKKYLDLASADDPLANRLKAVGTQLTDLQVRLGKIVAEQVLPMAEKILPVIDKAISYLEANPGLVKAALVLAGSMAVIGTILAAVGTIGQALVGIQAITAGLGIGGGAAGAGAMAGLGASIAAALGAVLPALLVVALGVVVAEGVRQLINKMTGQEQSWKDIGVTLHQLWEITKYDFKTIGDLIIKAQKYIQDIPLKIALSLTVAANNVSSRIGQYLSQLGSSIGIWFSQLGQRIWDGLVNLGTIIVNAIVGAFTDLGHLLGFADGGYAGAGVYRMGERGREFVMSNSTTRAAENIMGGQLSQQRLLSGLGGGRNINYHDYRRIDSSLSANDRRMLRNDVMDALNVSLSRAT